MGEVIKTIEKETDGKSFQSYKYCHDTEDHSGIEYDDNANVEWKEYGETEKHKTPINLKSEADKRKELKSIFTYFLDGSRHTYKIDDMSYNKNIYPILAGQISVGCCKRINKELSPELLFNRRVIVLPNIAFRDGWDERVKAVDLLKVINKSTKLKSKFNIKFDNVLTYTRDKGDKLEKKGIAVIQECMMTLEKNIVSELVLARKLDQDNYLIKDGSLDYQKVSLSKDKNAKNLSNKRIANYYKYVIGVSKYFDPTRCLIKDGGSNSDIIAQLKPFERTPSYMYQSTRAGNDVYFCIWYLRLREARYTQSVFDGVVKIEKLIVKESEKQNGVPSDEIDNISAFLLNERNPVCYGYDSRWANHIYPVYLTESYTKSKYLSNKMFMQLF